MNKYVRYALTLAFVGLMAFIAINTPTPATTQGPLITGMLQAGSAMLGGAALLIGFKL